MSVHLLHWNGTTCHVALKTPRYYFSFHPARDSKVEDLSGGSAAPFFAPLEWDIKKCGDDYDVIKVNGISEFLLDALIDKFSLNVPRYNLFSTNCSTTIASLLLPCVKSPFAQEIYKHITQPHPERALNAVTGLQHGSPADAAVQLLRILDANAIILTPEDVIELVSIINNLPPNAFAAVP
jgi:hypothetical protein